MSEEEIKKRLQELRNLRVLHKRAKESNQNLKAEVKRLKARIKELEERDRDKDQRIEAMAFQLEQIKIKLFGKKSEILLLEEKRERKIRNISSYQRPIPKQITSIKNHPISNCLHCNQELQKKSTKTFYEEDIPLPIQKIAIKHEVETGYCNSCKKQSSGIPIPFKKAILGENLKKYVCTLSIANRLSHSQIQDHLQDVFDLRISIGEIGNILEEEALSLRPEYQALKESVLNQSGTHYDETSWPVQKEEQGRFAWVTTGTENNDTVFSLGRSRGKGNIDEIGKANLGITDDYGAYKNSFNEHQLCWAHPHRKIRDLAESQEFEEEKKNQILKTYEQFSELYQDIRKKIGGEFSMYQRRIWQDLFSKICKPNILDPVPLQRIKESLRRNREKYFTFLDHPGIPIDNNKAERALRHLVIKRRTSFGSKTQRGAETTSILASVILSLKWNDPLNWFQKYLKLGF